MERGAAANERSMRVGLMDGARAGLSSGKMLSSGITSAAGSADIAVSTESISVCLPPLHNKSPFFLTVRKAQAGKGPERMYDAYASQPTARCALCTVPRARVMAHQVLA